MWSGHVEHNKVNINVDDVQTQNVLNNVDRSSLKASQQNCPNNNKHIEQTNSEI